MKATSAEEKIQKRIRRCGLLTIRESPEIVYPLEEIYVRRKMEEQQPEMGSPPPHDVRVAVEEVFFDDDLNAEDPNLVGVSKELLQLKERAKKLSEDLKQLSSAAQDLKKSSSHDDFEEIMRRYSDFVQSDDDEGEDEDESQRKVAEVLKKFHETEFITTIRQTSDAEALIEPDPEMTDESNLEVSAEINDMTEEEARAEALETIRNFRPKRPIVPSPLFPDLCLKNEKKMRSKLGGSSYWYFPFRHSLYDSMTRTMTMTTTSTKQTSQDSDSDDEKPVLLKTASRAMRENPLMLAPTGDIYSYFARRQVAPHYFTPPLRHEMTRALGGASRKLQYSLI